MKAGPSYNAVSSLKALQCKVLGTTYNPTHARTGAKVLRQRLQGPSMLAYYPPTVNFRSIEKLAPGLGRLQDVRETQRLKDVERKKMLGKGPPKKEQHRHILQTAFSSFYLRPDSAA
ncbi:related to RSM27 - mitochondrial ribosomal protein, small subunit [Ustilago bromivora]|uniref:Small ribosomal subunit protein mS33 n=1 Tax=Ustilago bromivora TaxID=307758 RepID=A0A8H8TU05_9BASI|nr:related to RSM27 - mitochondrial ribosomal protein, small subunit [Ustilago bromivora]